MPSIKHIVEPIMFLYMFAEFMGYTIFQNLLFNRLCLQKFNESLCSVVNNGSYKLEENHIEKQTSNWILYNNVVLLIPSTCVCFFFGSFSDTISRKIVIVLPIIGNIFLYGICMLVSYYETASLAYLLIGNFLSGLFGGYIGMLMAILSYATHVTEIKFRTIRIGIVESMIFFAGTIGVFLSGILLKYTSYVKVYGIMCGCSVFSLIYCIIIIEDIGNAENSLGKKLSTIFRLKHIKDIWSFIAKSRDYHEQVVICMSIGTIGMLMFLTIGEININQLFLKHSPLSFTLIEIGYYAAITSLIRGLSLIVLLPILKKYFKPNDFFLCLIGIFSKVGGSLMLGLSKTKSMVYCVPIVGIFMGFSAVALRGICSGFVLKEEQGKLFTIVASLENIMSLLASISFNELYSVTVSIYPGLSYFMSAIISGILFFITLIIWQQYQKINEYTSVPELNTSVQVTSPNNTALNTTE